MIPSPTVFATAVVANAPARFASAAISDGDPGRERARRDRGRDRVRRVVEAVREVEREREDDRDDEQRHRFLTKIASSTSAAFSQASTASSSCSWMSFQRMIVRGSAPERKRSAIASRFEPVALVLELAQREELPLSGPRSPRAARPPRAALEAARWITSRLLERPRRHVAHLVRVDVVGRLVDVVADVVDHRREPVHVVAVERRHERPVEQVDHLVGEPVALVLELPDVAQPSRLSGQPSSSSTRSPAIVARVRRGLREQVEELAVSAGEPESHGRSTRRVHHDVTDEPSTRRRAVDRERDQRIRVSKNASGSGREVRVAAAQSARRAPGRVRRCPGSRRARAALQGRRRR